MKRILFLLCLFTFFIGAKADETANDYVFATALQYDSEYDLYYFDVKLNGSKLYTSYGMDIQLPAGMEVVDDEYGIFVEMIKTIYPTYGRNKEYTHSVNPAFPYPDDHSHLRVGCMSSQSQALMETSGDLFRVYVTIDYASNSWPLGEIKIYDAELNQIVEGKVVSSYPPMKETIVASHTGATTLPLNISSAAKWSTCILPFSTAIPEGVKAYTCSYNDESNIHLSDAESIDAFVPYVLYSENGYSGTVSGTVNVEDVPETGVVSDGYLCGAIVQQTAKEGYVLQKQDAGVKFYSISAGDSFSIPAGKCWMSLQDDTQAKALGFMTDGTVTGINSLVVPTSGILFDVSGRLVNNAANGLFIKNGKKIIIK